MIQEHVRQDRLFIDELPQSLRGIPGSILEAAMSIHFTTEGASSCQV
jgi:hypothetical protein